MGEYEFLHQTVAYDKQNSSGPGQVVLSFLDSLNTPNWSGLLYLGNYLETQFLQHGIRGPLPFQGHVFSCPITIEERLTLLDPHSVILEAGGAAFMGTSNAFSIPGFGGTCRWDITAGGLSFSAELLVSILGGLYFFQYGVQAGAQPSGTGAYELYEKATVNASWFQVPVDFGAGGFSDVGQDRNTGAPGGKATASAGAGQFQVFAQTFGTRGSLGTTSASAEGYGYPGHSYELSADMVRQDAEMVNGYRVLVCTGTQYDIGLAPSGVGYSLSNPRLTIEEHVVPLALGVFEPTTGWGQLRTDATRITPPLYSQIYNTQEGTSGQPYTGPFPNPIQIRLPLKSIINPFEVPPTATLLDEWNTQTTASIEVFDPIAGSEVVVQRPFNFIISLDSSFSSRGIPIRQIQMAPRFLAVGTWTSGSTRSNYSPVGAPLGFGNLRFYRYAELKVSADKATTATICIRTSSANGFGDSKFYTASLAEGDNTVVIDLTNPNRIRNGGATSDTPLPTSEGYLGIRFGGISSVLSGTYVDGGSAKVSVSSLTGVVQRSANLQQGGAADMMSGGGYNDWPGPANYQIVVDGWVALIFAEGRGGDFANPQGNGDPALAPWYWLFRNSGITAQDLTPATIDLGDNNAPIAGKNAAGPFGIEWIDPATRQARPSVDLLAGGRLFGAPYQNSVGFAPGGHLAMGKPSGLDFYAQYVYGYDVQATPIPYSKNVTGFEDRTANNQGGTDLVDRGDGLHHLSRSPLPNDIKPTDIFEWIHSSEGDEPSGLFSPLGVEKIYHFRIVRQKDKDTTFAIHHSRQGTQWGGWLPCSMLPIFKTVGGIALRSGKTGYLIAYCDPNLGLQCRVSIDQALIQQKVVSIDSNTDVSEPCLSYDPNRRIFRCLYLRGTSLYRQSSYSDGSDWSGQPAFKENVTHARDSYNPRTDELLSFWLDSNLMLQLQIYGPLGDVRQTLQVDPAPFDDTSFDTEVVTVGNSCVDVALFRNGLKVILRSYDDARSFGALNLG